MALKLSLGTFVQASRVAQSFKGMSVARAVQPALQLAQKRMASGVPEKKFEEDYDYRYGKIIRNNYSLLAPLTLKS